MPTWTTTPPLGLVLRTAPDGIVLSYLRVFSPALSPAAPNATSASASWSPTTFGTATVAGVGLGVGWVVVPGVGAGVAVGLEPLLPPQAPRVSATTRPVASSIERLTGAPSSGEATATDRARSSGVEGLEDIRHQVGRILDAHRQPNE